jgi:hypothetical protein
MWERDQENVVSVVPIDGNRVEKSKMIIRPIGGTLGTETILLHQVSHWRRLSEGITKYGDPSEYECGM